MTIVVVIDISYGGDKNLAEEAPLPALAASQPKIVLDLGFLDTDVVVRHYVPLQSFPCPYHPSIAVRPLEGPAGRFVWPQRRGRE